MDYFQWHFKYETTRSKLLNNSSQRLKGRGQWNVVVIDWPLIFSSYHSLRWGEFLFSPFLGVSQVKSLISKSKLLFRRVNGSNNCNLMSLSTNYLLDAIQSVYWLNYHTTLWDRWQYDTYFTNEKRVRE